MCPLFDKVTDSLFREVARKEHLAILHMAKNNWEGYLILKKLDSVFHSKMENVQKTPMNVSMLMVKISSEN